MICCSLRDATELNDAFAALQWLSWILTTCAAFRPATWSHPLSSAFSASSVQFISVAQSCLTLCEPMDCSTPCQTPLSIRNSCPSSRWCHPLLSPSPPVFNLFQYQVFSSESALWIRLPKYWRFSFSISPSSEHPGLISFRMDWLDLLAVQGTLKSLLQHHSSKASILRHSASFIVQLSQTYMIPGKTIALTRWIFVAKVMSLLFDR